MSAVVVLLLAVPTLASAATRYASPSGTGDATVCSQADPCEIEDAVEDASVADGDEVIVTAGSYDIGTGSVDIADGITVRGSAPGQRPTITSSGSGPPSGAITITDADAEIRDLDVASTSTSNLDSGLLFVGGVVIERVSARAPSASTGCFLRTNAASPPATIRDSVCSAGGSTGAGLLAFAFGDDATAAIFAYNVTAISATSPGLRASSSGANSEAQITAYNAIALGDNSCPTCYDVAAENSGAGSEASATMFDSNFDVSGDGGDNSTATAPGSGGNQTAPPVFVDAAAGDYHQALSSPTIDAGDAESSGDPDDLGALDLDGEERIQAAVDIGADEVPDGDGDGVPDANDACPAQAAATANGCPTPSPTTPTPTNPTPTPPTPPATPDKSITDLDATARKTQKQKGKKIKIKLSVGAAEAIEVKGKGTIEVKGQKKGYKLKPQTKQVEGGERTILRLKLKKKQGSAKKVAKAIKRYKKAPRKKKQKLAVKAPVQIVATDSAGNTEVEKRVVRLK